MQTHNPSLSEDNTQSGKEVYQDGKLRLGAEWNYFNKLSNVYDTLSKLLEDKICLANMNVSLSPSQK